MPIVIKYLITAALVVFISEVAKRSDHLDTDKLPQFPGGLHL